MNPGYQKFQTPYQPLNYPNYPDSADKIDPSLYRPNAGSEQFEESYIENIIRLNKGKTATFYMTYNDSLEYRDKVYRGIIQAAGKDHIVISDTKEGRRYILLLVYLDYVEFDEPINYEYPIK